MESFEFACCKKTWIAAFMISSLREEPYCAEPAPYPETCGVNDPWETIVSPGRTQFAEEREFEKRKDEKYLCDKCCLPFESERVEYSGFWMKPTKLDFAAETNLIAPEEGDYSFLLITCGGAKLYVNGEYQGGLYGYQRNQEKQAVMTLHLQEGENKVYIQCNDMAERDSMIYFKLRYLDEIPLIGKLLVKADLCRLESVRKILSGAYLEKFHYHTSDISVHFSEEAEELVVLDVQVGFSDAHIPLAKYEKICELGPGQKSLQIGDLIDRKAGMVSVRLSVETDGICVERTLQFEYYDESIMKGMQDSNPAVRKKKALDFLAQYGIPNFQKALAMYETGRDTETAEKIMGEEIRKVNERYDCSDFRLPAFFYALNSNKIPEKLKRQMEEAIWNYRYWKDEPGNDVMWFFSENHALCFHASELLAGERYPEHSFTNSGMTGAEHAKKAEGLLQIWFQRFLTEGFAEWNSPVYIPIDVIGMIALYDLAVSPRIRQYAKEALDKTFQVLAANSFQGVVAASYGRIYFKNLIGRRTSEASALNYIASGTGWLNQHCFAPVLFAMSKYELPHSIEAMYTAEEAGEEENIEVSSCGEEGAVLYSYKTKDYIMASVMGYREGKTGLQEHVFQLMVGDCDTQIWINHPGEAKYFGSGRPSYFAGNGTLPQVKQKKNKALLTYHLLEQEVKYTHAYCPFREFDCWMWKNGRLFLKKGSICVELYARNGLEITERGPLKYLEIISEGRENEWYVEVVKLKEETDFLSVVETMADTAPGMEE